MKVRSGAVLGSAVGFFVGAVFSGQLVHSQISNEFDGTINHVAIVVRDVDQAARVFGDVFSADVPTPQIVTGLPFAAGYRDGTTGVKITTFSTGNVRLELIEPLDGPSPWKDFLDQRGEGIHHLAFDMGDYNQTITMLQDKGGIWELGNETMNFGYVDMTKQLGFTLEVFGPGGARVPAQDIR